VTLLLVWPTSRAISSTATSLDGSGDAEPVSFGLDGTNYEVDLGATT
jgi:hypothetical protein